VEVIRSRCAACALGLLAYASFGIICGSAYADWNFYPGDYSDDEIIGNSLPGTWRPFSDDSPWNSKIGPSPPIHTDNSAIMVTVLAEVAKIRFENSFLPPIWVINFDNYADVVCEEH
jgi:hypothetical protein